MTKKVQAVNEIAKNGTNNCKAKQNFNTQFKNAEHLEQMEEKNYTDSYKFVNDICDLYKESVYKWFVFQFLDSLTSVTDSKNGIKTNKPGTKEHKEFLDFAKENTNNFTCKIVRVLSESETKSEKESTNNEDATKEDLKADGKNVIIRERIYKQIPCTDFIKILLSAKGAFKYSKGGAEQNAKNIIKQNKVSLAELLAVLTPEQKKALGM